MRILEIKADKLENTVKNLRRGLKCYQEKLAVLSLRSGNSLLKKKKLEKLVQILEKMRPLRYFGAQKRLDILRMVETMSEESADFVVCENFQIIKNCSESLNIRLLSFKKTVLQLLSRSFDKFTIPGFLEVFELSFKIHACLPIWQKNSENFPSKIEKNLNSFFQAFTSTTSFLLNTIDIMIN